MIDDLLDPTQLRNVVIVRALPGLGDMLCAVPALRALRAGLPQARITLLGMAWAKGFVERFSSYVNDFVEFPGYPGIPEVEPPVRQLPEFFAAMHNRDFDLAIQMHGSGITSNPFTVMLGAHQTGGCYLPGEFCPDERFFLAFREEEPEVWRLLRLVELLGVPPQGDELEFPVLDEDAWALGSLAEARELRPGEYVCIHPGAKLEARRWPPERFARIGDALAARGLRVVLTGTAAEAGLTAAVATAMSEHAIDLAGRTGLGALAALLSGAQLLVSNDTGLSHLAAALCTPSVVVFTTSDHRRWAPLDRDLHRIVLAAEDDCTGPHPTEVLGEIDNILGVLR